MPNLVHGAMSIGELVELVGRRWNILQKLRLRRYYVSELAKDLGKTLPEVSKNLKNLEKNGLLQSVQGEGRLKYYYERPRQKNSRSIR